MLKAKHFFIVAIPAVLTLASYISNNTNGITAEATAGAVPSLTEPLVKPAVDSIQAVNGKNLFLNNCSKCHGESAEGHPNWKEPDPNGKYPAPPLNGEGHAWHHTSEVLRNYIKEGSISRGGSMKPFGDRLNDSEISDILAWLQSMWPDKFYAGWAMMEAESRKQDTF